MPRTLIASRAFTLIELLVVISIIALLIAILLPALESARSVARLVSCSSQVRQISIAFSYHTNDNNGKLPYGLWYGGGDFRVWDDYINEYITGNGLSETEILSGITPEEKASDLLICPSDPTEFESPWPYGGKGRSYIVPFGGYKQYLGSTDPARVDNSVYTRPYFQYKEEKYGPNPIVFSGAFERAQNTLNEPIRFEIDTIPNTSETLALIEKPQAGLGNNNVQGSNSGQDAASNPFDQWIDGGSGQLIAGEMYHGGSGENNPLSADPISNYGFLDGHAQSLKASETLREGTPWNSIAADYMWTRNPND